MTQGHLNPDTLAAYSERALPEEERASVTAHLAECGSCREWLAVHAEIACERNRNRPAQASEKLALGAAAAFAVGLLLFTLTPRRAYIPVSTGPALVAQPLITFARPSQKQALPAALAGVQLNNNLRFVVLDSGPATKHIAVTTALGERWIAYSAFPPPR